MNRTHKQKLLLAAACILSFVCIFCFVLWKYVYLIRYTPDSYAESTDELSNPYIGWYTIQGYLLSDTEPLLFPDPEAYKASGSGLVLLQINLKNYADGDLSDIALLKLDQLLSAWQNTGSQLILRFVYDWDGNNLSTEPKELSLILRHMDQTAEVIQKYTSSVYLMQGIYVGNWGEMNNSSYMDRQQMTTLLTHLASVTDPSVFLAVRTPAQLRTALDTGSALDASRAFDGTLPSRLGLFNDGMLGSETDTGTYGNAASDTADHTQAWSRKQEIAFQNALCRYVPNGGEVISNNPYNDLDSAIKDLSDMHVSYLNRDYDPEVLNKWKSTAYTGSEELYHGLTGYDYISRHLGYRYVLTASDCSRTGLLSRNAILSFTLKNTGFSSCYRPLRLSVHAVSESGGVSTFSSDQDLRFLSSGDLESFEISLDLSKLESGSYTFYLQISDPALTHRKILLANTTEHTAYGYRLGTARISKLSD